MDSYGTNGQFIPEPSAYNLPYNNNNNDTGTTNNNSGSSSNVPLAVAGIKFESELYHVVEGEGGHGYNYGTNGTYPSNTFQQPYSSEFNHTQPANQGTFYGTTTSVSPAGVQIKTDEQQKTPPATPNNVNNKKQMPATGNFECDICQKVFSSNPSLRRHREIHSGQKKFSCELCGNSYTQKHNLTKHLRVHTGEKPYACTVCDKTFYVHHHLKNHMLQHTGEYPFTCRICTKGFKHKSRLEAHLKNHDGNSVDGSTAHSPSPGITSEDNSMSEVWENTQDQVEEEEETMVYNDLDDLLQDIDEDDKSEAHECQLCRQIFIDQTSLDRHVKLQHGLDREFKSDECSKVVVTQASPVQLREEHTEETIYECKECRQIFIDQVCLDRHVKLQHVLDNELKCEECNKVFVTRASLVRHRKEHTGETIFECEECHMSFRWKVSLHIHMRRHNNDVRRYECSLCNKYFLSKEGLKKHSNLYHNPVSLFECRVCASKFQQKSEYESHMLTHSDTDNDEKPLVSSEKTGPTCKTCHKVFSSNSSLRKHEYTHMDEKPHKCAVCNVSFAQKIQLRLHNKRHNGGMVEPPMFTVVRKNDSPSKIILQKEPEKPTADSRDSSSERRISARMAKLAQREKEKEEEEEKKKMEEEESEEEGSGEESEEEDSSESDEESTDEENGDDEENQEEEEEEEGEEKQEKVIEEKKSRWEGYRYPVCPVCDKVFRKTLTFRKHYKTCRKKLVQKQNHPSEQKAIPASGSA